MARLLIVHHTSSPSMQAMLEAVLAGAGTDEIEGVDVLVRPALAATAVDVLGADGQFKKQTLTQRRRGAPPGIQRT